MVKELGQYRILERLGSGAMGDVYVAEDKKLARKVALKMLPAAVADSPQRRKALEREAQVVASLNHPNIVTVFSVEEAGGEHFITMELVEGATLRELLPNMGVKRFLELAVPLADAVGVAHRRGLIHRDLKPENIMVSDDGLVKVLDFGLAKLMAVADESKDPELATRSRTEQGALVGTFAYMSPEQAEGKTIDERSDIFALGIIFFEMLAGRHPFRGGSAAATLSGILSTDPHKLSEIAPDIPHAVARIVARCLAKEPSRRYQSAIDLRNDLDEARDDLKSGRLGDRRPAIASSPSSTLPWALAALSIVVAVVAVVTSVREDAPPRPRVRRFAVQPSAESALRGDMFLSPDGSALFYQAEHGDARGIYVRPLDELTPRLVAGTEGASNPFISDDGEWLAFQIRGQLRKVPISGGEPVVVCDAPTPIIGGGSWGLDGSIVFGGVNTGLMRVSAEGGTSEALFEPDLEAGDLDVHEPQHLPDGRGILYTLHRKDGTGRVEVYSLTTRERKVLVDNAFSGRYTSSGHLVYGAPERALFAAPFDLDALELTAPPVRVHENVMTLLQNAEAFFDVASDGTLAYVPEPSYAQRRLVWVERDGSETPIEAESMPFDHIRLSPDGTRLAVAINDRERQDIWVYDLESGSRTRVTFEGFNEAPVWTSNGERITFTSNRDGAKNLYWKPADGSGLAEALMESDLEQEFASSWSPDGNVLAYVKTDPTDLATIRLLRPGANSDDPFASGPGWQRHAVFSPDGRWIAYGANGEIFVRPFSGPGGQIQVSSEGGNEPRWRPDGREILYRRGDEVFVVPVETTPTFSRGAARALFRGSYVNSFFYRTSYDVTRDGRLLMVKPSPEELADSSMVVVDNWFEELRRRAPLR